MRRILIVLVLSFLMFPVDVWGWYRLPSSSMREPWPPSRRVIQQRASLRQYLPKSVQKSPSAIVLQPPALPHLLTDPLPDTETRSSILLLGSVSPIVGAARVFMEHEPLDVSEIRINLVTGRSTVDSFLVYRSDNSLLLGRAYLDTSVSGNTRYTLWMKSGQLIIPKGEEFRFYVRVRTRPFESGGISGEVVQVSSLGVAGSGDWSNRSYAKSTTETHSKFQTARSQFTVINNAGSDTGVLSAGPGQLLGEFSFGGVTAGGSAILSLVDITYTIEQAGGVSVSNGQLRRESSGDSVSCTSSSTSVTCSALSETFGSVRSGVATFRLYGDVAIPADARNAYLRLTLNQPGDPDSSGAISWTDGTSSFSWVPFEHPIVRGTLLNY